MEMAAVNKAKMDAMIEHINAILCSGGRMSEQNKDNAPPATNTDRGGDEKAKKDKRKKKLSPHCNMFAFHKPNR
jgi:hypothetical protein